MKKIITLIAFAAPFFAQAQKTNYKVIVSAFYNLENLYDTIDNPIVSDEEFTPSGPKGYNSFIYWDKISKLSRVLTEIGTDYTPDGAAIIGVAEIENDTVLTDLTNYPSMKKRGYKFVHYDSRDARGVDVGMLYNPKYFKVDTSAALFVKLPGGSKDAYFTRDILWVRGTLDGEKVDIYVNHWPSRRGGEERSQPARNAAAQVAKNHIDSIRNSSGERKVILMGDLNDDPTSPSLTQILKAKGKEKDVKPGGMFNPFWDNYKAGNGTSPYNDAWGLFDQIVLSYPWLDKKQSGYFFHKDFVHNKEYLTAATGRYKGYSLRTWDGNSYQGGYSDHFPTYVVFLKKVQ